MGDDPRREMYRQFQDAQHEQELPATRASARLIFEILFDYFRPASVVDVGCGLGGWLASARDLGVGDLRGVENDWTDAGRMVVDPKIVHWCDLEAGFSLERRFDLAVCIEVAEHLSPAGGDRLVASLAGHADLVLFSAAIPFQGGMHHVNEQFPDYWAERFARYGFRALDLIRPRIWNEPGVLWWLRQNVIVFAHERVLAGNERLREEAKNGGMLSVVHPGVYLDRVRGAEAHEGVVRFLAQGGTFHVTRGANGELNITRA